MPFLKSTLKPGMRYVFRGKVAAKNGAISLEQPAMYTLAQYNEVKGSMQPIYPLTKGLSNKLVT
jgi:ATP-dependent DNA helicase RecG